MLTGTAGHLRIWCFRSSSGLRVSRLRFSFAKRIERGDDRTKLLLHVLKRAAIIFGVGLLLNGFPYYNLATIRIPGVLQRIAICYLIAATIFLFTRDARPDPLVYRAVVRVLDSDEDDSCSRLWRG